MATMVLFQLADESVAPARGADLHHIGARRLHTVMSQLLNDILFDVPDEIPTNAKVVITKDTVQERLGGMVQDKDLSEFIL